MNNRVFDLGVSIPLFLIALPVILVICVAVSIESRGAPIFRQTRLGKDEKLFSLYKIRTMKKGTGDHPTHTVGGEHITRIGRFLRKSKFDELPQFWNVIIGDMRLVGPRPNLPNQQPLILIRRQYGVFRTRPGITGLAQVNNIDMSTHETLAIADKEYIERQNIWLDIQILLSTFARTKAPRLNHSIFQ
ncbi:sugar transferase [Amylibacter ulvae]|uniref:Sugar transferase n=1 Tax=Paramylibacter ulvae TaxID=1651968 RepID=A0ABQ3CYJ4_9RHOB|nr:sugar transferase [Amylibacter ulvae]GHA47581.1 sugar transferase [Amylibacter ulvae]